MADKGFGSELWRQARGVRIAKDGTLRAPVRANGRDGIVAGVDRTRAADRARQRTTPPPPRPPGRLRRWWGRISGT